MIYLPLAAGVPFLMKLVGIIWVVSALLLMFVVLIQKGKGGGLSGAFGGLGAGGLLGTKTGDFLTWVTIGLVTVFLGLGLVMVKYYRPSGPTEETPTALTGEQTPTAAPAEGAGAPGSGSQPAPAENAPAPTAPGTGTPAASTPGAPANK